jgi:hypothetical protein
MNITLPFGESAPPAQQPVTNPTPAPASSTQPAAEPVKPSEWRPDANPEVCRALASWAKKHGHFDPATHEFARQMADWLVSNRPIHDFYLKRPLALAPIPPPRLCARLCERRHESVTSRGLGEDVHPS